MHKISELNVSAFIYRLFYEDFFSITRMNTVQLIGRNRQSLGAIQNCIHSDEN